MAHTKLISMTMTRIHQRLGRKSLLFAACGLAVRIESFSVNEQLRWGNQRLMSTSSSSNIPSNKETVIHFNHAGASPSPSSVIERVVDHMYLEQRLGGYAAAAAVQDEMKTVYELTAKLLHASSADEIALVESATVAWTRIFYAMAEHHERIRSKSADQKVILVSEAEYAAQVIAVSKWAREHDGWSILAIPSALQDDCSSTGMVDLDIMEQMLKGEFEISEESTLDPESIAVVCVTQIPTNSGIVNPVEMIGDLLKKYENPAFYLVDACQSIGQRDVNVQDIGCHGLCGTGRKYLRAPRGSGVLWVDSKTASILRPSHVDHESAPLMKVPSAYPSQYSNVEVDYKFRENAKRFEFWESSAASKLGFGEAVRCALEDAGGMVSIAKKIRHNSLELQEQLTSIDKVKIHYPDTTSGIVTFQTEGLDAHKAKQQLWIPNIIGNMFEVSVVPATSTPLDSARTAVPDLLRASVSYTTTKEEIKLFCDRLKDML